MILVSGPGRPLIVLLTPLEPQSRSGDKPVKFKVVLSPNGTAVLKGLIVELGDGGMAAGLSSERLCAGRAPQSDANMSGDSTSTP